MVKNKYLTKLNILLCNKQSKNTQTVQSYQKKKKKTLNVGINIRKLLK